MDFLKINLIELLDKSSNHELVLPNFQRSYVWKPEQQKMLVASFLVNLPIGTFLILEGEKGDFISKELCYNKKVTPTEYCSYLLDGQQRLSTIKNVFSNLFGISDWHDNFDLLHFQLRNRWFLDLEEDSCKECLGYDKLNFKVTRRVKNGNEQKVSILETKEPNDILDAIKYYTIFKSKRTEYYQPGFRFKGTSDYDKMLEFSAHCAISCKIPLFDFLSDDKTIIKDTLKNIAQSKMLSLINELENGERESYEKSQLYLGHLDSNIQSKYKNQQHKLIYTVWEKLRDKWVEDILDYFKDLFKAELMVPNIKSNELSRATSVFEYMNKGGTPLDTFDIMVAKYADIGDKDTLYDKLDAILSDEFDIPTSVSNQSSIIQYSTEHLGIYSNDILVKPIKEQFLNFLCLIDKQKESQSINGIDVQYIKKEKILALGKIQIENSLEEAGKALKRALAFLQFRCGVFSYNSISYNLLLIPIGMILKEDSMWNDRFVIDKIEFWYWTALFSGRFREKQNQRAISESKELYSWCLGEVSPEITYRIDKVFEETNYSDKNTLLLENEDKSVPTAIYNGILQYILSLEPNDFSEDHHKLFAWKIARNGENIQDHHIIPLGSAKDLGESSKILRNNKFNKLNSPLNRTYITQKANNYISSLPIEKYLPLLNKAVEYSHCIGHSKFDKIETSEKFQDDFLNNRFAEIKNTLKRELDYLRKD